MMAWRSLHVVFSNNMTERAASGEAKIHDDVEDLIADLHAQLVYPGCSNSQPKLG